MQLLAAGQNTQLPTGPITLRISWDGGTALDAAAVLVTSSGKVRTDDDFVFYNQPTHRSNAVKLVDAQANNATLFADLTQVEPAVDRIVATSSVHTGTFGQVSGLTLEVYCANQPAARFQLPPDQNISAVALAEIYRRGDNWKVRAIGQGWESGLTGLATDYGISVDDDSEAPAEPAPAPADPHQRQATGPQPPLPPPHRPDRCLRCGQPLRARRFRGGFDPCRQCEAQVNAYLPQWRSRAAHILATSGPNTATWNQLWSDLRDARINEQTGRELIRPLASHYVERLVSFAFADGIIEESELAGFERDVALLQLDDHHVRELRARMLRGRAHSKIRDGDLPQITSTTVHLDADERLHLDVPATQVRFLASGPKYAPGRLLATNKKLRFVADRSGFELAWAKAISVAQEYGTVSVGATLARGGGTYQVAEADYVAAVLEGTMRVAKRLVLNPGQRDTRSIPPHVKQAVWSRDGGKCVECDSSHYLEYDHVIPLSQGGATSIGNLQILCRACNLAKGARI